MNQSFTPPPLTNSNNFQQSYSEDWQVPHVIHQTAYSKELPPEIVENIERLKALNPNWAYRFYDDNDIEQYLATHYPPQVLEYFRRIHPSYGAAKADLFRYLLIYREGGVYLDIKSTITRPIEETLSPLDSLYLSYWDNLEGGEQEGLWVNHKEYPDNPRGEIMQWCIVAPPYHPMIREVIIQVLWNLDHYCPFTSSGGQGEGLWGTFRTTGPIVYTHTLLRETIGPVRFVNMYRDCGFVYSIYSKPGEFAHKRILKSDYRKSKYPIITHRLWWVQTSTLLFLRLLKLYASIREKVVAPQSEH